MGAFERKRLKGKLNLGVSSIIEHFTHQSGVIILETGTLLRSQSEAREQERIWEERRDRRRRLKWRQLRWRCIRTKMFQLEQKICVCPGALWLYLIRLAERRKVEKEWREMTEKTRLPVEFWDPLESELNLTWRHPLVWSVSWLLGARSDHIWERGTGGWVGTRWLKW